MAHEAQRRYRERNYASPLYRYRVHRQNARSRGISFLLTFDEWWVLWEQSGKWELRGNRRGQYCMARPGDRGAYEIGNVMIVLNEDNRAERNQNYPMKGENNPAFGKDYWTATSEAEREQRSLKMSVASKGRSKSAAMREKLSKTVTGRRRAVIDGRLTWVKP